MLGETDRRIVNGGGFSLTVSGLESRRRYEIMGYRGGNKWYAY